MNYRATCFVALCFFAVATGVASAQANVDLQRRSFVGIVASPTTDGPGVRVSSVLPNTTGAALGIRTGDLIRAIDGTPLTEFHEFARAVRRWRAGIPASVLVDRAGTMQVLRSMPVPFPRESLPGITSTYGDITTSYGDRIRTIVTRPAGASTGRLPAILFVPWLSCSSVELSLPNSLIGVRHLVIELTRAGYAVWRVEKPGVGDSEGPDCSALSLKRELAAYRAGYAAMVRSAGVDTTRTVLLGHSLGGALAPVIALDRPPSAIVVIGTYSRSWFEHVIDNERRRMGLWGHSPAETEDRVRKFTELYTEYLVRRRLPGSILAERPHLNPAWSDEAEHQHGRPATFFHEVQDIQPLVAWRQLGLPTLVVHGEYDWLMSRIDHQMVVDAVNAARPGSGSLAVVPRTDHSLVEYANWEDARIERNGSPSRAAAETVVGWLTARLSLPR